MSAQLIRITSDVEIPYLPYQGQPVLTFASIDAAHGRPEGTAKAAFHRNRKRFTENEDFYVLESESLYAWRTEFPDFVGANAPSLTLITESGYLMLVKPFNDDRSWQIQRQLVKLYFRVKAAIEQPQPQPTLSAEQWKVIRDLIHNIEICCKWEGSAGFAVNERIRFTYGLRSSSELRPEHFDDARTELEGLKTLACQHLDRMYTLDKEFITAVLRPPVSIRKVRAMAKKQTQQPPLNY